MMTYTEFRKETPILYGIVYFEKTSPKIGAYVYKQNPYTGMYVYRYYSIVSKNGKNHLRKGNYAIYRKRAFELFTNGQLSLDPENGNKENWF